jgi:hypothetical protein
MNDSPYEVKPLIEFHSKTLLWKQTYALFSDRITVNTTHRFSGNSHATYLLTRLTPLPMRGSTRGEGLTWGILLMFLGFGFIGLQYYIGFSGADGPPNLMIVMGFSGLIWFLYSLRQWHYAIFSTAAGVEALSLWSTPKKVTTFGPFVDACVTAIETARSND